MLKTKLTVVLGVEAEQPEENYGCSCPFCRERWPQRIQFQNWLVCELATTRPDIPNYDIWDVTIQVCNAIDHYRIPYLGLHPGEIAIHSKEFAAANPEVIHGTPKGRTLQ